MGRDMTSQENTQWKMVECGGDGLCLQEHGDALGGHPAPRTLGEDGGRLEMLYGGAKDLQR